MRKHPNIYELGDLTLLRWQYSLNWCTDSIESLSKSQLPFCKNWQANSKIHMEIQKVQNSQNKSEKKKKAGGLPNCIT